MSAEGLPASRNAALRLALDCDLGAVRPMTSLIRDFLREHGAGSDEVHASELAVAEACNNAIKYVNAAARQRKIQVEVLWSSEQLELRVNDHTNGFEWPKQIDLPDAASETGRGLYLIQSVMDRVQYFRGRGENCLVMQKNRHGTVALLNGQQSEVHGELQGRLSESEKVIRDMAEELSFCYESLSAIFRCSAELGKSNDLEDFARRLLGDLAQITSAEWFVFRQARLGEAKLEMFVSSDSSVLLPALSLPEAATRSVEAEAASAREDVWFDYLNPLKDSDPLSKVRPGSVGLVHPIYLGDTLIGTLTIAKSSGSFTAVQANVVHTFADFLAIQIVNARFTDELVRNRLVSRELEIAKTIQRSLLPKAIPRLSGYGLAGFCESAHQVGGDFYDVIKITDDTLLLIIADVMGKGIPAAMFAAILRSLLRAVPEWMNQPAALLARVNRLLFEELSGVDMFITAQLVYVDSRARRITAASAGHCPVLLALDGEGNVKTLAPEGLPLGILPDTTFSNHTEILPRNCRVLLYTDGLTEARNSAGEFFGQERLIRWLRKSAAGRKTAEELKEELASELASFQSTSSLNDDQTFLIMAE
ncbi:MAG TPA: SpoIIE family protein phosphatase [Verrucomicrobiae bacterium]|nr:SpoIIE family protein phosphatase [Verrucomicrobiae bacterium]